MAHHRKPLPKLFNFNPKGDPVDAAKLKQWADRGHIWDADDELDDYAADMATLDQDEAQGSFEA